MHQPLRFSFAAALAAALMLAHGAAPAQGGFPNRPVRFIVPFAPGGGLDITGRPVAQSLSESLGKPVVVDNRPGAGGIVGLSITAKAPADGHTVVMISASHVIQAIMMPNADFDFFRDLAPITELISTPYLLTVFPGLPPKTVNELVAYAKSNPGKLVYASAGNGTLQHLSMELFLDITGTKALHVPYKGVGPALTDLFAGRAHVMMSSLASLEAHVRAKTIRAMAITSRERSEIFPELPTMVEAGVKGFIVEQWQGMMAPAGTPPAIIERLQRESAKALGQPHMAGYLKTSGARPVGSTPQQFKAKIHAERGTWAQLIKRTGLKADG